MQYDENQQKLIHFLYTSGHFFWAMYPQWFKFGKPIGKSASIKGPNIESAEFLKINKLYEYSILPYSVEDTATAQSRIRAQSLVAHLLASYMFPDEFSRVTEALFSEQEVSAGKARFIDLMPDQLRDMDQRGVRLFIDSSYQTNSPIYGIIFDAQGLDFMRMIKGEIPVEPTRAPKP